MAVVLTSSDGTPTAQRRKYGGVEAAPISEMRSGVRIGIYGPGGAGKTTCACTVVDSEYGSPALYLDARGNPEVARSRGDRIEVVSIGKFSDVEAIRKDVVRELDRKEFPFKSVILDNLSEMHAMDLRDRYGATADIQWTMHSASTSDLLQLARNWTDLATIYGINIIFVAWDTPETRTIRGVECNRSELAFNKALQSQLPGIISWLGRLYITEEKPPFTRCLDFRPIERLHQAKFQIDPDDEFSKDVPLEIFNPSLASILDTVKGRKPWPTAKHAAPGSGLGSRKSAEKE